MGPIVIFDKSTFQSLGHAEQIELSRHFMENLTPILALEIIGDLTKEAKGKPSEDKVQELARKFGGSGPTLNIDHRSACIVSLMGGTVPMTGQIAVGHGTRYRGPDGSPGLFIDLHPINEAILRWARKSFKNGEYDFSEAWRELTRAFSLQAFEDELNDKYIVLPTVESLQDIPAATNIMLRTHSLQEVWLNWSIRRLQMPEAFRREVLERWTRRPSPYFSDFAPYAYFCLRALLALHFAVQHRLVRWNSTNLIDLNYLFYLPFCMVFSSNDNLHSALAPLLLRNNQSFVLGTELKADLSRLACERGSLDEAKRRRLEFALGSYPIPSSDSVVTALWAKHMQPWWPGMGNRAIELTPEEEALAHREAIELFTRMKSNRPFNLPHSDRRLPPGR